MPVVMPQRRLLPPALGVAMLVALSGLCAEARADDVRWSNPFASGVEPPPGRLSAALRGGSIHGKGLGFEVGVTALPWLEGKISYGYNSEHSGVAFLKTTFIPTANLSPYLVTGYGYQVSGLRGGISFQTHLLVTGLGLQARFAQRYYIGGELTANIVLFHRLTERSESFTVEITDPWGLFAGFVAGVWFL